MKTKFKVGMNVECLIFGKGKITSKSDSGIFKWIVDFENGYVSDYTHDGRYMPNSNITLTPGTWEVKEILPEPEFEQGEPVWVRDDPSEMWKFAYYNKLTNNENYKHEVCDSKGNIYNYKYVKKFIGQDPNEDQ